MQSSAAGIAAKLESAAIMRDEARDIWRSPEEKALKAKIRTAMKSGNMHPTTAAQAAAAVGGSHESAFLSAPNALRVDPSAKVYASEALISALRAEIYEFAANELRYFFSTHHSFLKQPSAKPVDGANIKANIFATQQLRQPAGAVSATVHEDVDAIQAHAKQTAVNSRTHALQEKFRRAIVAMRARR